MAQQGPDANSFGPSYCVVNKLVNRVDDVETFTQKIRNNLQVLTWINRTIFSLGH